MRIPCINEARIPNIPAKTEKAVALSIWMRPSPAMIVVEAIMPAKVMSTASIFITFITNWSAGYLLFTFRVLPSKFGVCFTAFLYLRYGQAGKPESGLV